MSFPGTLKYQSREMPFMPLLLFLLFPAPFLRTTEKQSSIQTCTPLHKCDCNLARQSHVTESHLRKGHGSNLSGNIFILTQV